MFVLYIMFHAVFVVLLKLASLGGRTKRLLNIPNFNAQNEPSSTPVHRNMKKGWQRNILCFRGGPWLSETAGANQSGLGLEGGRERA